MCVPDLDPSLYLAMSFAIACGKSPSWVPICLSQSTVAYVANVAAVCRYYHRHPRPPDARELPEYPEYPEPPNPMLLRRVTVVTAITTTAAFASHSVCVRPLSDESRITGSDFCFL